MIRKFSRKRCIKISKNDHAKNLQIAKHIARTRNQPKWSKLAEIRSKGRWIGQKWSKTWPKLSFFELFRNFYRKLQFYVKWAFTKLPIITLYLLQLGYDRRLNLIFNHNRQLDQICGISTTTYIAISTPIKKTYSYRSSHRYYDFSDIFILVFRRNSFFFS